MKKTFVRVLALSLITVMVLCAFASCSKKLSGSYESELSILGQTWSVTYDFKGDKVTVTSKTTVLGTVNTNTAEGTYEIIENDDGTMEITLTFEKDDDTATSGTYTFEEGEGYIKIGGKQYNELVKK